MYSLICYKPPSKRSYEALEYLFDNTEDESFDANDAEYVVSSNRPIRKIPVALSVVKLLKK